MGRKELPLLQVLDLAIGTPEVGCLNTSLVYVVLKALITHNKVQTQSFVPLFISFCPPCSKFICFVIRKAQMRCRNKIQSPLSIIMVTKKDREHAGGRGGSGSS